jgi:hypothetical protein
MTLSKGDYIKKSSIMLYHINFVIYRFNEIKQGISHVFNA